jgi:hypothetical protein
LALAQYLALWQPYSYTCSYITPEVRISPAKKFELTVHENLNKQQMIIMSRHYVIVCMYVCVTPTTYVLAWLVVLPSLKVTLGSAYACDSQ